MPKKVEPKQTSEEKKIAALEQQVKESSEKEKELLEKLEENKKVAAKDKEKIDPLSGPGVLCESWKVRRSEAMQDGPDENGAFGPIPDGFVDGSDYNKYPYRERIAGSRRVLIYPDTPDNEFVPNCQSKYTKKYNIKHRDPNKIYEDFKYDEGEYHLCEGHGKLFANPDLQKKS